MKFSYVLIILIFITGCSTERPKGSTEAEVLYKESVRMMDKGRYLLATEKLNTIKSKYPYSYYSSKAELMLADILFKQESFLQSASAYIIFKDFHPKHKKIPYVIWRIAESYFNQMPDEHDRDLSPGFEALKYYKELVNKFPSSEYVKKSYSRVKKCESLIMKKEKYIADFYFKTKVYDAAIFRYKLILSTFEDQQLRDHAMSKIIASNFLQDKKSECLKAYHEYRHQASKLIKKSIDVYVEKCK